MWGGAEHCEHEMRKSVFEFFGDCEGGMKSERIWDLSLHKEGR